MGPIGLKSNRFCRGLSFTVRPVKKPRPLVAVVDDEEPVRKAIQRLLTSTGLKVEMYASGAEFLESLNHHRPRCVVLDIHMTEVSGFEVQARLLRAKDPLPLIFITGNDTDESKRRVMDAGAAAYLLKPVDEHLLLAAVTAAIEPFSEKDEQ